MKIISISTDIFEDYSKKEWFDDDWMYSLILIIIMNQQ